MNSLTNSILTVFICFVLTFKFGTSIRCWVCDSDNSYNCGDPFNRTHVSLRECELDRDNTEHQLDQNRNSQYGRHGIQHSLPVCKKVKQMVNNRVVTTRSCGRETDRDFHDGSCSYTSSSQIPHMEHCSVCVTDACNDALAPRSTSIYTVAATTTVMWASLRFV